MKLGTRRFFSSGLFLILVTTVATLVTACGHKPIPSPSNSTPSPGNSPTIVMTATPSTTPCLNCVAATVQVLWKNGVQATTWWGQPLSVRETIGATAGVATISDSITGDTKALEYTFPSGAVIKKFIYQTIYFQITNPVNAGNYSSGHIQFDIMLGPAFYSLTQTQTPGTGPTIGFLYGEFGPTAYSECSANTPLLSTTKFTHVSVPLASGFSGCNDAQLTALNHLVIEINNSSFTALLPGVQYYINNVQITPN